MRKNVKGNESSDLHSSVELSLCLRKCKMQKRGRIYLYWPSQTNKGGSGESYHLWEWIHIPAVPRQSFLYALALCPFLL